MNKKEPKKDIGKRLHRIFPICISIDRLYSCGEKQLSISAIDRAGQNRPIVRFPIHRILGFK